MDQTRETKSFKATVSHGDTMASIQTKDTSKTTR